MGEKEETILALFPSDLNAGWIDGLSRAAKQARATLSPS